jgi:hypothetical protein
MVGANTASDRGSPAGEGVWFQVGLGTVTFLVVILLCAASLFLGELNQDEGWYLYAARLVSEGRLPFVDFATTQGPVMSLVYGLAWPLYAAHGVAGGRAFTALLGVLCVLATAVLACRIDGKNRIAALLALSLAGVNVYQAYFLTLVKTYSLAGILLVAGFLALTFASARWRVIPSVLAGILFALAAGTRVSAIVVIPAVVFCLGAAAFWRQRELGRLGDGASVVTGGVGEWRCAGGVVAGAGLGLLVVFLPFAVRAPEAFAFGLFEYHTGREVGGWLNVIAYKAGFISRCVQGYLVTLVLLLLAGTAWIVNAGGCRAGMKRVVTGTRERPLVGALWLSVLAVTGVHLAAPFPYDDYQVMVYPLLACGVADLVARQVRAVGNDRWTQGVCVAVLLACLAGAGSSPVVERWFVAERDRIWWPIRKETPLQNLARAAGAVRQVALKQESQEVLTQDTYLAVEAGLSVPHGLELGPFSYFPGWDRRRAEACHVVNGSMLREILNDARAPVAAFSGYGLAIRAPAVQELPQVEQDELWSVVEQRYGLREEIRGFGQAGTVLRILERKQAE